MSQNNSQEVKKKKFEWTYIETIFCLTAALILIVPFLFTRDFDFPSFLETGQIGDTIGGTTAPFIGLLGAWLVYKALKAQIDANELIIKQFEHEKSISNLTEIIKFLREDIKDFKFKWIDISDDYKEHNYDGIDGISAALHSFPIHHVDELYIMDIHLSGIQKIRYFLESIHYVIKTVKGSDLDNVDKVHLLRIIAEIYHTNLQPLIQKTAYKQESEQPICKTCGKTHGIPDELYIKNHEILAEALVW